MADQLYRVGGLLGVVAAGVTSGAKAVLRLRGVFKPPKETALVVVAGDELFLNEIDPDDVFLTTSPVGPRVGVATKAAAGADTIVYCLFEGRAKYAERCTISGMYDFAVHGGAVGNINFGPDLPPGYVIESTDYDVKEAFTSAGLATVATGLETVDADAAKTAVAFDNAAYSVGRHQGALPDMTDASTWLATHADGKGFTLAVATAALTGGKMAVTANLRRAA